MEIPLKAQVECIDGIFGRSEHVSINPVIDQVTYLVVKEELSPITECIVPVDLITETIADKIRLRCSKAELEKIMKPELTDICYSTVLTFELTTQYGLLTLGAPTFPSLRKETIYRTGMNTRGVLLFMQYKLGEHIVGTASSLKDDWGIPYYRFLIHPKNKNKIHKLLLNLEDMNNLVYYIAPEFYTKGELYEYLMKKAVLTNSTFWSPRQIGALPKEERTTISYKRGTHYGILEPGKRKIDGAIKGEMLLSVINDKFEANQSEIYDNERLVYLGDQMLENYLKVFSTPKVRRLINDIWSGRNQIDPRDYLSLISILLYDCYVYIVTR